MSTGLKETNFNFPNQTGFYRGKVRDVYHFNNTLVIVATDRISAFDVILPKPIPFKGQILNQIASKSLNDTADIVPNWLESNPDPNVTVGKKCEAIQVEFGITHRKLLGCRHKLLALGTRRAGLAVLAVQPDEIVRTLGFDKTIVMHELASLDQVAYVRFASVYREFQDVRDFVDELQPMLKDPSAPPRQPEKEPRQ